MEIACKARMVKEPEKEIDISFMPCTHLVLAMYTSFKQHPVRTERNSLMHTLNFYATEEK